LELPSRDPISVVAAEIHLGRRPTALSGVGCTATIQVACHNDSQKRIDVISIGYGKGMKFRSPAALMKFGQGAQKIANSYDCLFFNLM
jgi:hypothetical protein